MKKTKLLLSIVSLNLAAVVTPTLANCSCNNKSEQTQHVSISEFDKHQKMVDGKATFTLTLDKTTYSESDISIKVVDNSNEDTGLSSTWTISKNNLIISVVNTIPRDQSVKLQFGLTITGPLGTWHNTIKGFSLQIPKICKIEFKAPEGVELSGTTTFLLDAFSKFGKITNKPVAIKEWYIRDHWEDKNGNVVDDNTTIIDSMEIYPVMTEASVSAYCFGIEAADQPVYVELQCSHQEVISETHIQYAFDDQSPTIETGWTKYTSKITIPAGKILRFKSDQVTFDPQIPVRFIISGGNATLRGCVLSMLDNGKVTATQPGKYSFKQMFDGTTSTLTINDQFLNFDVATLADCDSCFERMFRGCKLTNLPSLPNVPLGKSCFKGMFIKTTGYTTIPDNYFKATTLAESCYESMFAECSELITIPELPQAITKDYCYQDMFAYCTKLLINEDWIGKNVLTVENAPATKAYNDMFYGSGGTFKSGTPRIGHAYHCYHADEAVVNADVKAGSSISLKHYGDRTIDLSYSTDLENWTPITESSPAQFTTDCKVYLRGNNSSGLARDVNDYANIILKGGIALSGSVMGLLDNGAATITSVRPYCFVNTFASIEQDQEITSISKDFLPAKTIDFYCYYNMFANKRKNSNEQTRLTSVPDLPATNLAHYCYQGMFENVSLTTTPALPALEAVKGCYQDMFKQANVINISPIYATLIDQDACVSMFEGLVTDSENTIFDEYAEGQERTKFFTCPSNANTDYLLNMFKSVKEGFVDTPELGKTYYWGK